MTSPYLSLVVPAYNEAQRLPRLLAGVGELTRSLPLTGRIVELIVVCDGCTDDTAQVARKWILPDDVEITVIAYAPNRGKGYALRTAIARTRGNLVAFLDADGATAPSELTALCADVTAGRGDIVVGSRRAPGARVTSPQPWRRNVSGKIFSRLAQLALGTAIHDTQCGAKVMSGHVARPLFRLAQEDGFSIDLEIIALAKSLGLTVFERGIRWEDQPGSKVSLLLDGYRLLGSLVALRWRARRASQSFEAKALLVSRWGQQE